MSRIYNFAAGPACMPEQVLREAAEEMLDYRGSGMSVMEMSHRSKAYEEIIFGAESDIRALADISDDYAVLFLQGGASTQFAMAPMNLTRNGKADYLITGAWAKKAAEEAAKYTDVRVAATSEAEHFTRIPDLTDLSIRRDADYVHICENNTIFGTSYQALPATGDIPLVADMSSCIFSRPIDVSRYGLIYAGAQKNIGPAGLTLVIVRKDLIREDVWPGTPVMLRYKTHLDERSMFNTPPCYAVYMCGKVIRWLQSNGGLAAAGERNARKAKLLYDYLDQSKMFRGTVNKVSRSLMNAPFVTGDAALDAAFVKGAEAAGLSGLKGHRSVGGMRASLYNAMPYEGVEKLVDHMREYERAKTC
ncbi:MAG: 3-phosphoserine/phosphohydroxythreonine transaminase [Eubacteriales bacterium]|nr:3-phosphoserine/phosphohydroxythreonine transaminase [Eubacteriales bacterium]MDD4709927.1 3-phosphoserine/phosphohydroxythreonine transaminase [Eubacteriales bacterium]